jgi:hypothetical protein
MFCRHQTELILIFFKPRKMAIEADFSLICSNNGY